MAKQANRGEVQEWLRSAASFDGDACLLWPFKSVSGSGYPSVRTTGRRMDGAHRVVCATAYGPGAGMECAHNCGNKMCCNPRHLRWATHRENERDKTEHGTTNAGARNGSAKLTEEAVVAVREQYLRGRTGSDLARAYGVTASCISHIVNGRNWSCLERR